MAKYHVSEDGNPRVCQAKKTCPYGDLEKDHYSSKDKAREAYEQGQANIKKASLEGAKRGKKLLASLDATYKALKVEADANHLIEETRKIAREIFGDDHVKDAPYDREFMDDHSRKGLVDTMEGRTGERYKPEDLITMANPIEGEENITLPSSEFGENLPVGQYEGISTETGEKAFIRVYSDSTSRATKPDLRDDLPYRHKRALQKKDDFAIIAKTLSKEAEETTRPQISKIYQGVADRLDAMGNSVDWSDLDSASEALDEVAEIEEDLCDYAESYRERDHELSLAYTRAAEALFDAQDGAYEIVGHQTLSPMKKK